MNIPDQEFYYAYLLSKTSWILQVKNSQKDFVIKNLQNKKNWV